MIAGLAVTLLAGLLWSLGCAMVLLSEPVGALDLATRGFLVTPR